MLFKSKAARGRKSPGTALRFRVTAAFRAMARGTDPETAFSRTKTFYRSLGGQRARSLA